MPNGVLRFLTATASVSRGGADNGIGVGFEIAHLVEKWYDSPETNYGIKLAAHLEESQYNDNLVFHSSRSQTGTAPYLSLTYTEYVPVTGIEIVGKQERLEYWLSFNAFEVSATVYPENATNKEVIWESTNESAAYFYGDGIICAAGVGTTTITAKSADNNEIIDSFELEVYNIPIETLTITNRPENDTLESGETHQLSFEVGPDNATDKYFVESSPSYIAWSSNNTDVAYVDSEGKLTAGCYGTTIITASYGDIVDSFTLTVAGIETTGVSAYIEPIYNPMYIGETWVFSGAVEPLNATDKRTVCTSLNPDVVSVDSLETLYSYETEHTLTALSEGTATIRLEAYNDSSVYYEFTVSVSTFDEEIGLNLPYNNTLVKGETWQITTNPYNTITVGDSTVISNAGNGYITALNPGTTTIEIATRSGTEYFVHREITVIETCDLEITGIPTITDENNNTFNGIYVGQTYEELSVIKTPDVGGDVVWSSSDDSIAEVYYDIVRARVILIGKKPGTVTIYAEIPGAYACDEFELEVFAENIEYIYIDYPVTEGADFFEVVLYKGKECKFSVEASSKNGNPTYIEEVAWYIKNSLDDDVIFYESEVINIEYDKEEDRDGATIYAKKEGVVYVGAKVGENNTESLIKVIVKAPCVQVFLPNNRTLIPNSTEEIKFGKINPGYLTFEWKTSDSNIATVENGVIITKNPGKVTITMSYILGRLRFKHSFPLLVSPIVINNVPIGRTLFVNGSVNLTATDHSSNTSSNNFKWSVIGDHAQINTQGILTGVSSGKITIKAMLAADPSIYSYVVITIKKTKSYILYLPNHEIDGEKVNSAQDAQDYREMIAEKYYGNNMNDYTELCEFDTWSEFESAWNDMGNQEYEIGYVIIIVHGDPTRIGTYYGNLDNSLNIYHSDILSLTSKTMEGLLLVSCNAGFLDFVNNPADAFAKITKGAPVLASDGTVSVKIATGNLESFDSQIVNGKQEDGFMDLLEEYQSDRTTNDGWIIYKNYGSVYSTILGIKEMTFFNALKILSRYKYELDEGVSE